jgi:hypothetical protein
VRPIIPLRAVLEQEIARDRFAMPGLVASILPVLIEEQRQRVQTLNRVLVDQVAQHVFRGIVRSSFLIELVKTPKIETTKFEVRWADRLDAADPRFASFDECLKIFDSVLAELEPALELEENRELLRLFRIWSLPAYEIPLDYRQRIAEGYIHRADNISWTWEEVIRRVVTLRAFLLNSTNPDAAFFSAAYGKIQVKTYLTDRVQTGAYKTNREKRWEAHPASVHFALRRDCLEIEYSLVNQLCHFNDFPLALFQALNDEGLLIPIETPFRCPITMEPFSFKDFKQEVESPIAGKSNFQVGHMNPLKAVNDDPSSGHAAQNISWISSHGNRIQGHLSLRETRAMIRRIHERYEEYGIRLEEVRGQVTAEDVDEA